jgi:uncharacterized protein YndB with AHSA1/START domain
VNKKWLELRTGGATRRKWRIPDGKSYVVIFGALKVVAPPMSIKDLIG